MPEEAYVSPISLKPLFLLSIATTNRLLKMNVEKAECYILTQIQIHQLELLHPPRHSEITLEQKLWQTPLEN